MPLRGRIRNEALRPQGGSGKLPFSGSPPALLEAVRGSFPKHCDPAAREARASLNPAPLPFAQRQAESTSPRHRFPRCHSSETSRSLSEQQTEALSLALPKSQALAYLPECSFRQDLIRLKKSSFRVLFDPSQIPSKAGRRPQTPDVRNQSLKLM